MATAVTTTTPSTTIIIIIIISGFPCLVLWMGRKDTWTRGFYEEAVESRANFFRKNFLLPCNDDNDDDNEDLNQKRTTTSTIRERIIVVHIWRGNIEPCDVYTKDRYLTNQYYIDLIQEYSSTTANISTTTIILEWLYIVKIVALNRGPISMPCPRRRHHFYRCQILPSPQTVVEWKLDTPIRDCLYDVHVWADVFVMDVNVDVNMDVDYVCTLCLNQIINIIFNMRISRRDYRIIANHYWNDLQKQSTIISYPITKKSFLFLFLSLPLFVLLCVPTSNSQVNQISYEW